MKSPESRSSESTPKQSIFDKARNRLTTCLLAGTAMSCVPSQQISAPLSHDQRHEIKEDVISELEKRKICNPAEIELEQKQMTKIGLNAYEKSLADLFPSHDAVVQRILLCYPDNLRNPDHALDLLRRDIRVVRFLDEDMLNNPEFMLKATHVDKRVLDYGRPVLFENSAFISEIVKIDPKNIKYAFPYHLNHPGLFVKLMQNNLKAMDYLPKYVSSDPEFMERVGYLDPRAYLFNDIDVYKISKPEVNRVLKDEVWREKDHARMIAGSEHLGNLKFFAPEVRADVNFMLELMKISPKAYHFRDHSVRGNESLTRAWLQTWFKPKDSDKGLERLKSDQIDALMADLKALNIEFPDRFSLYDLEKVIRNRKAFQKELEEEKRGRKARMFCMQTCKGEMESPKKEPITLQLAAKADWNAAFLSSITDDLLTRQPSVLYFEVNTRKEALGIMDDLLYMHQPIEHFVISGHGSKDSVALGAPDPRLTGGRGRSGDSYFDRSAITELSKRKRLLADDARIIFQSCSVGEGAAREQNIANMFHQAFPQARLYAAKVPANIDWLTFEEDGKVADVIFSSGVMSTYRRHPEPVNECLIARKTEANKSDPSYEVNPDDLKSCRKKVFKHESHEPDVADHSSPAAYAKH